MMEYLGSSGSFASYGGTQVTAAITVPGERPYVFAELQTVSYSIHREKQPVRVLGTADPIAFTYGPRTVAGTLIFASLQEHIVRRAMKSIAEKTGRFVTDQMPPFHISIAMADEYGNRSKAMIYNCTIVDEGQIYSIEDLMTETTMSYFASSIDLIRLESREGRGPGRRIRYQELEGPVGDPRVRIAGMLVGPDVNGVRIIGTSGDVRAETYAGPDGRFALNVPEWVEVLSLVGYRNGYSQQLGMLTRDSEFEATWDEPEPSTGISGAIVTPDQLPVPGAAILVHLADGRVLSATTESDGGFSIQAPGAAITAITLEKDGARLSIPIPDGLADTQDLGALIVNLQEAS